MVARAGTSDHQLSECKAALNDAKFGTEGRVIAVCVLAHQALQMASLVATSEIDGVQLLQRCVEPFGAVFTECNLLLRQIRVEQVSVIHGALWVGVGVGIVVVAHVGAVVRIHRLAKAADVTAMYGGATLFGAFFYHQTDSGAAYIQGVNNFSPSAAFDIGTSETWGAMVQASYYIMPKW